MKAQVWTALALLTLSPLGCPAAPPIAKPPLSEAQTPKPPVAETSRSGCLAVRHVKTAPGVIGAMRTAEFWLRRAGSQNDTPLLQSPEIKRLEALNQAERHGWKDVLAAEIVAPTRVAQELDERFDWLHARLVDGRLVEGHAGDYGRAEALARVAAAADEVRVVYREAALWCVPLTTGLYKPPVDMDFDRNRCSGLHPTEVVRVMRAGEHGWLYVHTGHAVGWVSAQALSAPITAAAARRFMNAEPRLVVLADRVTVGDEGPVLRLGTSLPLVDAEAGVVLLPAPSGLVQQAIPASPALHRGWLPFTRRRLFEVALSQLGRPYGWGGRQGERDCSRLIMDVFGAAGLRLSRHSASQSMSGPTTIEVAGMPDAPKHAAIQAAGARGVILLYMKGHIMLYLGEYSGRSWALSSLSEYQRPCGDGVEVMRVDRVAISDLELGRGTPKRSFLERITRISVFGP